MKNYQRLFRYLGSFRREIALSIFFNFLLAIFSIASLTLLIPLLDVLFNMTGSSYVDKPHFANYGINDLKQFLQDYSTYFITNTSIDKGKNRVLLIIVMGGAVLFFLKNLFRYLGAFFVVRIKNGIEENLRTDLHKKLLSMDPGYFTEKKKGDIITRMTTDLLEIQNAVLAYINKMVQDPLLIIFTLIVLFIFSWKLTIFVLLLLPIAGWLISGIGTRLKNPSAQSKVNLSKILSKIEENISGFPIIKSFLAEEHVQGQFDRLNKSYKKNMNHVLSLVELSSPLSEFLGYLVIAAIIWWGGSLILSGSGLEPNIFITYILMFFQIITPAKSVSNTFYDIKKGQASVERVLEFLDTETKICERNNAISKSEFKDKIKVEDLAFAYGHESVIKALNFQIEKGETIALVGQSGAGKSTLAMLLNRFYDPDSGRISIDGIDYKDLKIADLRGLIGYISQDTFLFDDTVRNNLLIGKGNTGEEGLREALKSAHALDFVMDRPHGLETRIGEMGNQLSGGQKQRLVIARTILKDPDILILDEATSALDAESEKFVHSALEEIMKNRTAIIIAHRMSTIRNADRIIVMEKGRIVEQGKHAELLKASGIYQKLYSLHQE